MGQTGRDALAIRSATTITRGWPLRSKNTRTEPSSSVSPMAVRRTSRLLPRYIAMLASSPGCMP